MAELIKGTFVFGIAASIVIGLSHLAVMAWPN
jgi:hypothetical protein